MLISHQTFPPLSLVKRHNDGDLVLSQGNADKEISHHPISHQTSPPLSLVKRHNDGGLVLNQGNADKEISHRPISHQTFLMMAIDQTNNKAVIPAILHAPGRPRLLFPI